MSYDIEQDKKEDNNVAEAEVVSPNEVIEHNDIIAKAKAMGKRLKFVKIRPADYYKTPKIKNPKIAANIEMMHNKYLEMRATHKPHVKKDADPNSVQSRKIQYRLQNIGKKVTSHQIRIMFNMPFTDGKFAKRNTIDLRTQAC